MANALAALHCLKSAFVCLNILLCLALLVRAYRAARRGSLMTMLAGATAIAGTFIFEKLFVTYEMFLQNYPTFSRFADFHLRALIVGFILCEIGVIWEIATYRRRNRLAQ